MNLTPHKIYGIRAPAFLLITFLALLGTAVAFSQWGLIDPSPSYSTPTLTPTIPASPTSYSTPHPTPHLQSDSSYSTEYLVILETPLIAPTPIAQAAIAQTAIVAIAPTALVQAASLSGVPTIITLDELDQAATAAGWPIEDGWWPQMRLIITSCENPSLSPTAHNTSDPSGGSIGLAQLNAGWFSYLGEDPSERFDPVVNLRTALKLRQRIGGFGTGAGWSCFYNLGIDLRYEKGL